MPLLTPKPPSCHRNEHRRARLGGAIWPQMTAREKGFGQLDHHPLSGRPHRRSCRYQSCAPIMAPASIRSQSIGGREGQKGRLIADGPLSPARGRLRSGKHPHGIIRGGYKHEDAIRSTSVWWDDVFTSIHIEEYETEPGYQAGAGRDHARHPKCGRRRLKDWMSGRDPRARRCAPGTSWWERSPPRARPT